MIIGRFNDGSGYAFNNFLPNGVKYLTPPFYSTLLNPYESSPDSLRILSSLRSHGLLQNEHSDFSPPLLPKQNAFTVWFHVSNACNLSCNYCYIPKLQKAAGLNSISPTQIISRNTLQTTITQLFDYCKEHGFDTLQLKFAGGEPFLAEDRLEDACHYSSSMSAKTGINISYRVITNGVILSDRLLNLLENYNFGISISLDGGSYAHNTMRFITTRRENCFGRYEIEKVGTWNIIKNNVETLIASSIKPYILCTVTAHNHDSLIDLVEFCKERTIGFRLSLVRDKQTATDPIAQDAIFSSLRQLYKHLGDNLPINMPLERFARFAELNLQKMKRKVCGACASTICIDHKGDVSTCQMRIDSPRGNIHNETLASTVANLRTDPDNQLLVNPELKKNGACPNCEWRFVCAGGCFEHTRSVYGTIDMLSPWCSIYKRLLPVYVEAIAKQIKRAVLTT